MRMGLRGNVFHGIYVKDRGKVNTEIDSVSNFNSLIKTGETRDVKKDFAKLYAYIHYYALYQF